MSGKCRPGVALFQRGYLWLFERAGAPNQYIWFTLRHVRKLAETIGLPTVQGKRFRIFNLSSRSACIHKAAASLSNTLTIELPFGIDPEEARLLLATKLFEDDRVSLGYAAEMAGYTKRTYTEFFEIKVYRSSIIRSRISNASLKQSTGSSRTWEETALQISKTWWCARRT